MKAVILVGGEGTRLRPLTFSTPKAMVPILNRPFLEHMLEYLKRHGIDDVILTLCYLPDPIQGYFGDGSGLGLKLSYAMEGSPLGTAGAVKNVAGRLDETFYAFNGDTFTDIDLTAMLTLHRRRSAKATIALTPVDDPTIYGVVETDAEGRVQRFIEKPSRDAVTTNMINAGAYILEPEVMGQVPDGQNFSFEHGLFPHLLQRGDTVCGYPSEAYWIDIGTPQKYLKLHQDLLSAEIVRPMPGRQVSRGVHAGEGVEIHRSARLKGPLVIGSNCSIGAGASIEGPVAIGEGCTIGAETDIKGTVIWHNTSIGRGASIRGSVIAEHVSIGQRSTLAAGCVIGNGVSVDSGSKLARDTSVWPQQNPSPFETARS